MHGVKIPPGLTGECPKIASAKILSKLNLRKQ